jgi:hypothetical protein
MTRSTVGNTAQDSTEYDSFDDDQRRSIQEEFFEAVNRQR